MIKIKNSSSQPIKVSKRFDPRTGSWFEIAPMNQSRSSFAAVASGEFIYVFGGKRGSHGLRACERYCPRTNSWKNIAQLPAAIWQHSAVSLNGRI
jgi:N-acetylneuraminic acid mutarotase